MKKGTDVNVTVKSGEQSRFLMQFVNIRDVFQEETMANILDSICQDETDRILDQQWDMTQDAEGKKFLSMPPSVQKLFAQKDGLAYALYAYELTVEDFLQEFPLYIDSVDDAEEEFDAFMEKVTNGTINIQLQG